MKSKLKQAIYFYVEENKQCVMNYSSIGDCARRDGIKPVCEFLKDNQGVTLNHVEIGSGHSRRWINIVTDRAKLEMSARAANIKVLP